MTPPRPWPALALAALALGAGAWLGDGARAQAPPRIEYRIEAWTIDDTTAVLREVTGEELASVEDMAHAIERGSDPVDDPVVQAQVQARLQQRLDRLGAEGWDVFKISDARAVVGGVLLPAPGVYAKRAAR